MVQKAEEWIASLIEGQLSAAINWRLVRDLRQRRHPYIKQEPGINAGSGSTDGPYEDNGTDLKIRLLPNHLRSFQLLKILNLNSSDAALNCVVTDGFTEIRATLSDEAVATIEDELERRISLEDHGDIVTCKSASIHATPYGIPSCQVQLYVASLEYEYHLRKPIGKGTPIEARQIVINAVREITQLQDLKSGYVELDAGNGDEHAGGDVPPVAPSQTLVPRSSDRPTRRLDGPDSATHSQAIPATPHSPSGIRQPHSKRSRQTRFDREGLEVIQGVNFHKPVSIGRATTERESSPDDMPPRVVSRTTFTQLSNLLSKTKPSTSEEVPQKSQAESSRAIGSVVEGNNIPAQAEREPTPRNCGSTAPTRLTPAAPTPEAVNVALDADQPRGPHKHSPRTLFNYHRRKIPHDQQRLLESQLSWFPPLPGKQFPHPNVPIALLQKWKESASERSRGSKQNSTHTEQPSHPGIATSVEEEESSSESESDKKSASEDEADTDSDEMLSEEEWPPTPQVAQQLPPDSSLPGQIPNATPSQRPPAATGELELEVPRTIADPAVAHRKARSDHFRAMQRRKWIQQNYTDYSINQTSLFRIIGSYRAAHPNDTPQPDDMASSVKEVFPEWVSNQSAKPPSEPTFSTPSSPQATPNGFARTTDLPTRTASVGRPNGPPSNAPRGPQADRRVADSPRAPSFGGSPQSGTPFSHASGAGGRMPLLDSYRPVYTDSIAKQQPAGRESVPASSPMPPPPPPLPKRKIDSAGSSREDKRSRTGGDETPRHPAQEAVTLERDLPLPPTPRPPPTREAMTPFGEFVHAWQQLGASNPGGRTRERTRTRATGRLDVLSWGF